MYTKPQTQVNKNIHITQKTARTPLYTSDTELKLWNSDAKLTNASGYGSFSAVMIRKTNRFDITGIGNISIIKLQSLLNTQQLNYMSQHLPEFQLSPSWSLSEWQEPERRRSSLDRGMCTGQAPWRPQLQLLQLWLVQQPNGPDTVTNSIGIIEVNCNSQIIQICQTPWIFCSIVSLN